MEEENLEELDEEDMDFLEEDDILDDGLDDEDIANVEKEVKEAYIEYVCKGKELDNINS